MSRAAELRWYLRYTLLPRTDRWYASLFRAAPGQIAGDITPYYANLGDRQVARIHALLPDVKVIYLLRDPIARMWSEAAMTIRQYGNSVGATESAVLRRYFENRSQSRLTDYVGNLERWRRHFPSEQIFVGFFDDLERDPRALLRSIFTFLGVDASARHIATDVGARRNAGREKEIPSEWASCMAELFLPRIRQAHQYFDNAHTARWLAEAEGHLAKTTE